MNNNWTREATIYQPIIIKTMGLFDFLFGSGDSLDESLNKNWRETGHNYSRKSGNWTDADDWNCGTHDNHDGMFGFDSYEENDF